MTLPPFLHRITAAAAPLLPGLDETAIGERLEATTVALRTDAATAVLRGHRAGYLFAVNLAARLYPHLVLDAPGDLAAEAAELARRIHPGVTIDEGTADVDLLWRPGAAGPKQVTVACDGWLVRIDHDDPAFAATSGAVALAAAALGMSQVFRAVFTDELALGRAAARPWALHLVTLRAEGPDLPLPGEADLGTVHLAGCGAIGQAAAAALAELPVRGLLIAVDPDPLDLGNLQRYILSFADDVDLDKPALIERAHGTALDVDPVIGRWGDDDRSGVGATTVLTALDTEEDRIEVQASLPGTIYNAWTDPEHTGVSRHERFGEEPCLACLYWPRGPRPSRSERLARELGEHELRVLRYLADEVPAGSPLPPQQLQGTLRLPLPPEAITWTQRSLLDDFADRNGIDPADLAPYRDQPIDFLHRDRVCARLTRRASDDKQVSVPLAHQSALAGALLAISLLVARSPELAAHRPDEAQARYDVLGDNPQRLPSTVARRPHCICHDPDYVQAYRRRFNEVS
jgi:hypothetical protein